MTCIHEIKNNEKSNLFGFLMGDRAGVESYTVPEERGFQTTGNIGALLNSNCDTLRSIHSGIFFNPTNYTDSSNTIVGKVHPMKNDWEILDNKEYHTPLLYVNEKQTSELLPKYPNGVLNVLLTPSHNMTIGGIAAPQVAGISTCGINNINVLNNTNNDIGHEINAYGYANQYGSRALGQGKVACQQLEPGLNVPPLKVENPPNTDSGAYVAVPSRTHEHIPLYQVGDWTKPDQFPNNFINTFNDNVGEGCPKHPHAHVPSPYTPSPIVPRPSPHGPSGPRGPSGPHGPSVTY